MQALCALIAALLQVMGYHVKDTQLGPECVNCYKQQYLCVPFRAVLHWLWHGGGGGEGVLNSAIFELCKQIVCALDRIQYPAIIK